MRSDHKTYEIVPATPSLALEVAADMRQADVDEAWAANRMTPDQAVLSSMEISGDPKVGLTNGQPVVIFGVGVWSVLSLRGIPWLLGTDDLLLDARHYLRESRTYMLETRSKYKRLENYVDARNKEAVRWLRWLDFTMEPAAPFGPDRLPFHRFHWEID